MVRDAGNGLPDLVESGWSGRRLADKSRFLIASAFMALGAGLVIATLAAVHYHAQANGLRHLPRSPAFTAGCSCRGIAAGLQQHCSASRRWAHPRQSRDRHG
jgi:hypothetical protein